MLRKWNHATMCGRNPYFSKSFAFVFLASAILMSACTERDQRGWWRESHDGGTYLIIDPGGDQDKGERCTLDGQIWPYAVGERGAIKPGEHELGCPAKVGFKIEPGVEYHFDYWGP